MSEISEKSLYLITSSLLDIVRAVIIFFLNLDLISFVLIKLKYKKKIITALSISTKHDVVKYKDYSEISDIILFDSKGYDKSESFDHSLLDDLPDELNKMIAGNIQIDDIPFLKNKDFIVDLSGALEDQNEKKDIDKIDNLLNTVHNINS